MENSVLIMGSGGMDSTALLGHMLAEGRDVNLIRFGYGAKNESRESKAIKAIVDKYRGHERFKCIFDLPIRGISMGLLSPYFKENYAPIPDGHFTDPKMAKAAIPMLHTVMVMISTGVALSMGIKWVMSGIRIQGLEHYAERKIEMIMAWNQVVFHGSENRVRLLTPFRAKSKAEVLRRGLKAMAPVGLTWSCLLGGEKHCGRCCGCVERKTAYRDLRVEDPTAYQDREFYPPPVTNHTEICESCKSWSPLIVQGHEKISGMCSVHNKKKGASETCVDWDMAAYRETAGWGDTPGKGLA